MENNFGSIGVSEEIIKGIDLMGFKEPTKVQKDTIPYILDKKDLIVIAKTGSGKTGAFGIPLLQSIDTNTKGPQGLILTPTRELAVQINDELHKMGKFLDLTTAAVYGQHSINTEINAINKGASVITGTPGRVFDHISRKTLKTKDIHYLVLDEADRMLDMGFYEQVVKIIKALPRERVTLLFSATMPPEIQRICKSHMKEPITIELDSDTKTVDTIKQVYYRVQGNEKRTQLNRLLKVEQPDSCIIFCNTRTEVDVVQRYLRQKGYEIGALHGGNTQSSRMKTMTRFKEKKLQLIVATDVAARGLHIDDLALVINYDVPVEKDSYIHRIGRTGRIGNQGQALTLVTVDDLWGFYEIEEHVGVIIEEKELPTEDFANQCEKDSDSEWTKRKKENIKRLAERGPSQDHKHKSSNKNYQGKKGPSQHKKGQNNRPGNQNQKAQGQQVAHKPANANPQPKKVQKSANANSQPKKVQKPVEVKPQQREIDYRAEAKKLMERANIEQKPTLKKRIGKLFGKGE